MEGTQPRPSTENWIKDLLSMALPIRIRLSFPLVDFSDGSDGKASAYNVGDPSSIPGVGRSPEEGNGNTLQYSSLENPIDRGARQATVSGVARVQESDTT